MLVQRKMSLRFNVLDSSSFHKDGVLTHWPDWGPRAEGFITGSVDSHYAGRSLASGPESGDVFGVGVQKIGRRLLRAEGTPTIAHCPSFQVSLSCGFWFG